MFYGLPGLVLEADSYFESINALSISYESKENFQNKLKEVKRKINEEKDETILVKELFIKKENFQRMITKGKQKGNYLNNRYLKTHKYEVRDKKCFKKIRKR